MGYGLWPITDNHWRPVLDDLSAENASVALIELFIYRCFDLSLFDKESPQRVCQPPRRMTHRNERRHEKERKKRGRPIERIITTSLTHP